MFWGVRSMKRIYQRQVFCDAVRCRFCVVFQVLFLDVRRIKRVHLQRMLF